MKIKVKVISNDEFTKWIEVSNMFANSLIQPQNALEQFNRLNSKQRNSIKRSYEYYDSIRNIEIPKEDRDSESYYMDVLVDTHIIATEFDIDPLTAIMCVKAPCKPNEKVVVI